MRKNINLYQKYALKIDKFKKTAAPNSVVSRENSARNSALFSVKRSIDFSSLSLPRHKRVPKKSGELINDNPINNPTKKIEIECYYGALDLIQTELDDLYGSGIFKDLSLLSRKRILEVRFLPNSLPKVAFKKVVELYGFI